MNILSFFRWLATGTRYGYTAHVLTRESREELLKAFPPQYSDVLAYHVTVDFGVAETASKPRRAKIMVVGYADSGDGLEALIVAVNGSTRRSDGGFYHITLSLERSPGYEPKDANRLVSNALWGEHWQDVTSLLLDAIPTFVPFKS